MLHQPPLLRALRRAPLKALAFFHRNTVMCVAALLAALSAFVVRPDEAYLGYFDFKTLACLFSTLAVVAAFKHIDFFYIIASGIVRAFRNTRACVLALVWITFIGSMLIANDMALITFLPLSIFVLKNCPDRRTVAFSFVMQNIAANLGGMLTPFGNPQNLYLYSRFAIPNDAFLLTMFPSFALAVTLITVCCLVFVPKKELAVEEERKPLDPARSAAYGVLFVLSVGMVFRVLPYPVGLAAVALSLLFLDRRALCEVDFGLLFTFVFFFILAGNAARMPFVRDLLESLLSRGEFLVSTLSCQFISNVPTAVLLSRFTENWRPLLVGVNVGGVGTLVASLASLITFREFTARYPESTKTYFALYSALSFAFLAVLIAFNLLMGV